MGSRIVFIGSAGKNDNLTLRLELEPKVVDQRLRESPWDLVPLEDEDSIVWVNRSNVAYIQETGSPSMPLVG